MSRRERNGPWIVFTIRLLGLAASMLAWVPASAHAEDLRDFIGDLYGGRLELRTQFGNSQPFRFDSSSLDSLSALNLAITSGVGFFPLASGSSGFGFDYELGVPIEESLGPIAGERATTIGKGQLSFGISYSYVHFDAFGGDELDDISLRLDPVDNGPRNVPDGVRGPQNTPFAYELDTIDLDLDVDIEQHLLAILTTYGLTADWDVGVVVPLVTIEARARSRATINRVGFNSELFHNFIPPESAVSKTGGRATGIGDILLRSKYHFLEGGLYGRPDLAVFGEVKLPSGDEKDLLGTGETNFLAMMIVSEKFGPFTPYGNVGYEVTTADTREFDNLRYNSGAELRLTDRITLSGGVVGRWRPSADVIGDHVLDWSAGVRWNVWRTLVVTANLQWPENPDTGLRTDLTGSIGLEYTFEAGWR